MSLQKPEWFKVDPAKFLSDATVDAMTTVELGACFRLLCRQWIDGYIPDDLHLLGRLARLDASGMAEAWVTLCHFFPVVEPGKRANRFMWIEREKVMAELERRSDEGTRAARKRWDERAKKRDATPNGSPMPDPMLEQSRIRKRPESESEQTSSSAQAPQPAAPEGDGGGRKRGTKVALTHLRGQAAQEAFDLIWHDWPKRADGKYAKGDRLPAEKAFQAILDSRKATAYELVQAALIYATEHPHCTAGFVRQISTFFNPQEGLWAECLRIHRERGGKAEPAPPLMEAML